MKTEDTQMNMFLLSESRQLPERYKNIKTFGFVSANDTSSGIYESDIMAFAHSLKDAHYVVMNRQRVNGETVCYIFNISLEALIHYAGQYHASSFLYCEITQTEYGRQEAKCSYYKMRDKTLPYHKKSNPYLCIGNANRQGISLECAIPLDSFQLIDIQLTENLKAFENSGNVIDFTMNRVGIHSWLMRKKLYRGLL